MSVKPPSGKKFNSKIKSISGDQIELTGGMLVDSEMVTKIEKKEKKMSKFNSYLESLFGSEDPARGEDFMNEIYGQLR